MYGQVLSIWQHNTCEFGLDKGRNALSFAFFPFLVVCHYPVRATCLCHYCAAARTRKLLPTRAMARTSTVDLFLCPQALQDEGESKEGSWEKLHEVVGRLKDSCPSIAAIMEEKCQDVHSRYAQKGRPAVSNLRPSKGYSLLQDDWFHLWLSFGGCSSSCKVQRHECLCVPHTVFGARTKLEMP